MYTDIYVQIQMYCIQNSQKCCAWNRIYYKTNQQIRDKSNWNDNGVFHLSSLISFICYDGCMFRLMPKSPVSKSLLAKTDNKNNTSTKHSMPAQHQKHFLDFWSSIRLARISLHYIYICYQLELMYCVNYYQRIVTSNLSEFKIEFQMYLKIIWNLLNRFDNCGSFFSSRLPVTKEALTRQMKKEKK